MAGGVMILKLWIFKWWEQNSDHQPETLDINISNQGHVPNQLVPCLTRSRFNNHHKLGWRLSPAWYNAKLTTKNTSNICKHTQHTQYKTT